MVSVGEQHQPCGCAATNHHASFCRRYSVHTLKEPRKLISVICPVSDVVCSCAAKGDDARHAEAMRRVVLRLRFVGRSAGSVTPSLPPQQAARGAPAQYSLITGVRMLCSRSTPTCCGRTLTASNRKTLAITYLAARLSPSRIASHASGSGRIDWPKTHALNTKS